MKTVFNGVRAFIRAALFALLAAALLAGCADDYAVVSLTESGAPLMQAALPPEESGALYTDGGSGDVTTAGESVLDENGVYSEMEDVALYLYTYGELPDNFITKSEARELGWSGGGLEDYAPGMCIGGDTFGNREGLLPEGNYHECDVGTLGEDDRGAERIVWDEKGNIYYTADHYESFELVYAGD